MWDLNLDKGLTVNDLYMTIYLAERALKKVLEENPKAGVVVAKGKKNERKMRYSEALKNIDIIRDYFGYKGCSSFGVCASCTKWDTRGSSNNFGKCSGKMTHAFDSCPKHSKEGGGYGL